MADSHHDEPRDGTGNAEIPVGFHSIIGQEVKRQHKEILQRYWRNLRLVMFGFSAFVILITTAELIGGGDIIRTLHSKTFPVEESHHVAISYEAFVELRGDDPQRQAGHMSFYARRGQKVKLYALLQHRFRGEGEERRVVVSIDGKPITKPRTELLGGFQDITDEIGWQKFEGPERIHRVGFTLDDSQAEDLTDEISIVCMVLVYGVTD